jgi:hypothetical protein
MDMVCLLVAGVVRATLPAPDFTLAWTHSIEKTRWQERYRVEGDALVLVEARVEGTGAGMEPPPSARFADGAWTWRPRTSLPELRLTLSSYAADYTLCWREGCRPLGALVGSAPDGSAVVVRPCQDSRKRSGARS